MKKYQLVIFDVDGTLLNTTEGVLSSVKYTIHKKGLEPLNEEVLKQFIGPPIQDSFSKFYGITEKEKLQELAGIFRNQYKEVDLLKAVPYEGIYDVLDTLKENGLKLAVATYKRQDYTDIILHHFGFDRYTDVIYGADHENKLKKKDIIELCLKRTETAPKDAVMIGDTVHDAQAARELEMDFLGVTYGFGFQNASDVAAYTDLRAADVPKEIQDILGCRKREEE